MKINRSREWFERRARAEADLDVTAGVPGPEDERLARQIKEEAMTEDTKLKFPSENYDVVSAKAGIQTPEQREQMEAGAFQFIDEEKRVLMLFTRDGRIEPGPGLSLDESTQGTFKILAGMLEEHRRLYAETEEQIIHRIRIEERQRAVRICLGVRDSKRTRKIAQLIAQDDPAHVVN